MDSHSRGLLLIMSAFLALVIIGLTAIGTQSRALFVLSFIFGMLAIIALLVVLRRRSALNRKQHIAPQEKMSFEVIADDPSDLAPLPHALKAVELAKASPTMLTKITLRDIGFIASWDTHKHHIYRTRPIPTSAHSIQPYIQVYLTEVKGWNFDFEVYDAKRKLLFKHRVSELLAKGYHLIVPPARLPLQSPPQVETWTFGVRVNGKLLAGHQFTWREVSPDALADYLDSDGEIGDDALLLLGEHYTSPLSLDDLLTQEAGRNISDVQ